MSLPHSLFFGGLRSLVLAVIAYYWLAANAPSTADDLISARTVAWLAPGACTGYLSHLALDAMNPSGVWLFMPRGTRVGLPRERMVRTGSFKEFVVGCVMAASCVVPAGPVLGLPVLKVLS